MQVVVHLPEVYRMLVEAEAEALQTGEELHLKVVHETGRGHRWRFRSVRWGGALPPHHT
jgi:hypothetical protein